MKFVNHSNGPSFFYAANQFCRHVSMSSVYGFKLIFCSSMIMSYIENANSEETIEYWKVITSIAIVANTG